MNTITYFLEANVSIALVAIYFIVVLQQETNFRFQRIFILGGVLASLLFPFIQIESTDSLASLQNVITYALPEFTLSAARVSLAAKNIFTPSALIIIYFVISFILFVRFLLNVIRLARLWHDYPKEIHTSGLVSFSFLNMIFIGESYSADDKKMILDHECVHAKLFHSADIILFELLKVIFWFNPFVYLLRKKISNIHEFQADELAVKEKDVEQYCSLLARVALQSADFPIANYFNNSLTLKRISMITQEKTKLSRWKIILSVALIATLFLAISCNNNENANPKIKTEKTSATDEVFTFVQESATPVGGMSAMYEAFGKNLKYPPNARQKGIEGKVILGFIVNKDGSISDIKLVKGIGEGCDEAAIKALTTSNLKWNPGKQDGVAVRQKFVLPIVFKLGDGDRSTNTDKSSEEVTSAKKLSELVAVGKKP